MLEFERVATLVENLDDICPQIGMIVLNSGILSVEDEPLSHKLIILKKIYPD